MMWKEILQLIFILSGLVTIQSYVMDSTCRNKANGLYRHRSSCKQFIHCAHGRAFYKVCPIFMEFNERTKTCDTPENAKCEIRLAAPVKSVGFSGQGLCKNNKYAVYGVPDDCRSYIVCINGKKLEKKCPLGLRFHPKYKVCVYGKATDCMKNPFCAKLPDGIYSHPKTCKSFITCSKGLTLVKDCPPSMLFDSFKRRCTWKWNSICKEMTPMIRRQPQAIQRFPLYPKITLPPRIHITKYATQAPRTREKARIKTFNIRTAFTSKPLITTQMPSAATVLSAPTKILHLKEEKNGHFIKESTTAKGKGFETFIITGEGYPAVPNRGKNFKFVQKLKNARINFFGINRTRTFLDKAPDAEVKVVSISYEAHTLAPREKTLQKALSVEHTKEKMSHKEELELRKYIKNMNAQVNFFSKQLSKPRHMIQNFPPSSVSLRLKRRQMLSKVLKDFLRQKIKTFKPYHKEPKVKEQRGVNHPLVSIDMRVKHKQESIQRGQQEKLRSDLLISKVERKHSKAKEEDVTSREEYRNTKMKLGAHTPISRRKMSFSDVVKSTDFYRRLQSLFKQKKINKDLFKQAKERTYGLRTQEMESYPPKERRLNAPSGRTNFQIHAHLSSICNRNYDPVCGSDYVTYFNDCHLALQSCNSSRSKELKKLYDGPCKKTS